MGLAVIILGALVFMGLVLVADAINRLARAILKSQDQNNV